MEQRLGEIALADGRPLAFATVGRGPALIFSPGWVSHLGLGWATTNERRFFEGLAHGRTVIRYDRPGTGLSRPAAHGDLVETELAALGALRQHFVLDDFDLLATSMSAPLAVEWAAREPASLRRLVLYGGWVDGSRIAAPEIRHHILGLVAQHWGLGSDVLTDIFAPDADAEFRASLSAYQRGSVDAQDAAQLLAAGYDLDVADRLAEVRARTTIIHRRGDRAVPVAEAEAFAAGIDGAELVLLPGRSHILFTGDVHSVTTAVRRALGMPAVRELGVLTPRQFEVAGLVFEGLSNKQIAERLVITERSAESHVERIRERLGFRSRSQVAAWYGRQR